ncbi:MAG: FAD-dependent thymidylate synthase [Thermoplasmata archaeon]|nr:FAD-dependent thymidylate synthase [Thermoplasmata archaeon]
MRVTLAGATLDRRFWKDDRAATPETISAAYARISHSPKGLQELRDEAVEQLDRSRRSNESIVYKMGHSSIAEHAVFNLDIEECSRLLVEFIESHRLASYTERSQRYVFFGDRAFQIPKELLDTEFEKELRDLDGDRLDLYTEMSADREMVDKFGELLLEQTRYVLGLTCPTDLGMTVNARELEHIISAGAAHPLEEVRSLSEKLLETSSHLAPSLIKYTGGADHAYKAREEVREYVRTHLDIEGKKEVAGDELTVPKGIRSTDMVCQGTPCCSDDPEAEVVASMIFELSDLSMHRCRELAREMDDGQLLELLMPIFEGYPQHASMPRSFEMMDLTFDFDISATGYAQLKRHRMVTLLVQAYDPNRWETPEAILEKAGYAARYWDLQERGKDLHGRIAARMGEHVAQYVLSNANVRRVVIKLNMRELYHFARLRSDVHAQKEIRDISGRLVERAIRHYPIVCKMLCGKDRYCEVKEDLKERACSTNTIK